MRTSIKVLITLLALTGLGLLAQGEKAVKTCPEAIQACVNQMAANYKEKGWLGLEMDYNPETGSLVVKKVINGSPAETAGITTGEIFAAINGAKFGERSPALEEAMKLIVPGNTVTYTLVKDGQDRQVKVTLGEWPADVVAMQIGKHVMEHHIETASVN